VLRDLLDDSALVVVDLAATTLLDAHSVGVLATTQRMAVKHGAELKSREAHSRADASRTHVSSGVTSWPRERIPRRRRFNLDESGQRWHNDIRLPSRWIR
jgi:hypothetical protein